MSKMSRTGLIPMCGQGCFFLEIPGENCFWPFPASRGTKSLACGSFLHLHSLPQWYRHRPRRILDTSASFLLARAPREVWRPQTADSAPRPKSTLSTWPVGKLESCF